MQKFYYYTLPATAFVFSTIAAYQFFGNRTTASIQPSPSQPGFGAVLKQTPTEPEPSLPTPEPGITPPIPVAIARTVTGSEKASIFQRVVDQQASLGLCLDNDNLAANLDDAAVYQQGEDQYLVSVLCFMAAYQGAYEFVYVDGETITHSRLALAGFPTFDPETSVLSNGYKFNGAGTCLEDSEYYWDGYSLRLISASLIDGVPNGCADLGVRSPSADYLITAEGVGPARLGMTFREFKAQLPEAATLEAVPLGVDLPTGWQVNLYGAAQFVVAFDGDSGDNLPSDQDKIIRIMVDNPSYRTAAGVGPGTPLSEAIAAYGPATLSYSTENESRELIQFADSPFSTDQTSWLFFRSNQWTLSDYAGIYPDRQDSYQTTTQYEDHAAIGSIWLTQY
ncbi:DUF1176 domain-containing protein [Picosynechococcus sp. PCC 7117]|uniref:DUF1176 domain-containing protein n=1 Tax=Picosynechococcus sp. PCC 7117 TaxID=195498 RepID=UPI000810EE4D|nr:DUF1176 domain-containing protein [Picosynechococcus sp. PCC 7117]ANV87334.1 hypothetical protein AWQ22_07605 [Picosynechococcus sp. PCC 7117]